MINRPGNIVLLGSGETSPTGGRVFEKLLKNLPASPVFSILETPAGFELNSHRVAEKVGSYFETRLQNSRPRIEIIPARKKGTEFSPDNAQVLQPLLTSDVIYMGAGSPTYTIRQLEDSLAWELIRARHFQGASVVLASAAIIAAGARALPVYEIFKVGEDPRWVGGLDFLAPYGLTLAFVPHWNNQEGGADLDTSRCYLGQERFNPLLAELPEEVTVVGLDELTAVSIDFSAAVCEISGLGSLHIVEKSRQEEFPSGSVFPLSKLGAYRAIDGLLPGISAGVWDAIEAAKTAKLDSTIARIAPDEVIELVNQRQSARQAKDWQRADEVRKQIEEAGWQVNDTPAGPLLAFMD